MKGNSNLLLLSGVAGGKKAARQKKGLREKAESESHSTRGIRNEQPAALAKY